MSTALGIVVVVVVVLLLTGPAIVCFLKGKTGLGIASLVIFGCVPAVVGAIRLATPDSWWSRRYYGPEKLTRAWRRFPDDPLVRRDRDEDIRAAWEGQEINPDELDPITRRALKKAGLL